LFFFEPRLFTFNPRFAGRRFLSIRGVMSDSHPSLSSTIRTFCPMVFDLGFSRLGWFFLQPPKGRCAHTESDCGFLHSASRSQQSNDLPISKCSLTVKLRRAAEPTSGQSSAVLCQNRQELVRRPNCCCLIEPHDLSPLCFSDLPSIPYSLIAP
jgi:hypothetical protein